MKDQHICLRDDIEYLVVETDEKDPVVIATIDRTEEPIKLADGYIVRFKFTNDKK